MSNFIGPVLPDQLKNDDQSEVIGPALPPGWKKDEEEDSQDDNGEDLMIGPVLPPNLRKKRSHDENDCVDDSGTINDKRNRPDKSLKLKATPKVIGPVLPASFSAQNNSVTGLNLPMKNTIQNSDDSDDDSDDEFTIGPLPPSGNFIEVEESRHQRSTKVNTEHEGPRREEWIASLPETSSVAKRLGFGKSMTSFSQKPVSTKEIEPVEQDTELDEAVNEYNKSKRAESLVDMHKKELKKKKSGEKKTRELFDFNPEDDMKIKQMDSQQTKAIVDKAKFLDSRFSAPRGSSKFL